MRDGFFKNDEEHQLLVNCAIRKYQPEIVLANILDDRHPDHGRAGHLIADACFLSGLVKIETRDENGNHPGTLAAQTGVALFAGLVP